ncbi:MAG: hypothetical protein EAZ15_08400 [Sphingobacteriales bacterium]|nr:MAG: hypothetical protein EAZ15_08400 [Sphingobacteriales bacterium]
MNTLTLKKNLLASIELANQEELKNIYAFVLNYLKTNLDDNNSVDKLKKSPLNFTLNKNIPNHLIKSIDKGTDDFDAGRFISLNEFTEKHFISK